MTSGGIYNSSKSDVGDRNINFLMNKTVNLGIFTSDTSRNQSKEASESRSSKSFKEAR